MMPCLPLGLRHALLTLCLLGVTSAHVCASHYLPGTSQLAGTVYIDRNNDGVFATINDPNPEYIIDGVEIQLFRQDGGMQLIGSAFTDLNGYYSFTNLLPGTYSILQVQPVAYVDGIDTLGTLYSLINQPVPASAFPGHVVANGFSSIVLPADVIGLGYNFGERGLAAGYVSKRYLFGSTPSPPVAVPEPATGLMALAMGGMGALLVARRAAGSRRRGAE